MALSRPATTLATCTNFMKSGVEPFDVVYQNLGFSPFTPFKHASMVLGQENPRLPLQSPPGLQLSRDRVQRMLQGKVLARSVSLQTVGSC